FFTYLNLFVFAMLLLITADNFLMMFVGWEGVGLCSYLLIGFWYGDNYNAYAGRKAFVVNRIGDFGFLLGIFFIVVTFHSVNFQEVFGAAAAKYTIGAPIITVITSLLFVGAMGKSAQIPLYVWLPDAMAGPTPVSALIHAATMVTAGVYMVARANVLYTLSPISMALIAVIGVATAFFAATMGMTQFDIKRMLAYSTISQLGYMFVGVGVGAFAAGIFHLMTHAFFKALLFMGAGSIMHAMSNSTDMRMMGGLKKKMPITYWTFLMATLAISGIPGFSGFFSKDEILWQSLAGAYGNFWIWLVGVITAGLTAFYMFRAVYMTFHGELRAKKEIAEHVHEAPSTMTVPLLILGVLAVIGGYIGIPKILGGSNPFEHFLDPVFEKSLEIRHAAGLVPHISGESARVLELPLMGLTFVIVLVGIGFAYLMYLKRPELPGIWTKKINYVYQLVFNKYYVDEIYETLIVNPMAAISESFLWKFVDVKIIDGFINGTGNVVRGTGRVVRKWQTGFVQNYALSFVIGVVILVFYIVFM
ncbi:MAG TPA: NADH-quinone oxidoreductase subunit L, partial [Bacteroidetes bacterium]|nr:NADH-quinone oxidoreductase subunit L [Bacteroidota bacterium]